MTTAVPVPPTDSGPRSCQPWRGRLAAVEVVLVAIAGALCVWCWHRGTATILTPNGNGQPPLASSILYGNWAAAAIGLAALGALLLLDVVRRVLRWASTVRRRPPHPSRRRAGAG